jgi:predicted transcriptional regulator
MAIGGWRAVTGAFLDGLWFIMIGLFLRQAAAASYEEVALQQALGPLKVRDGMTHEVMHVSPEVAVGRAVEEFFRPHGVASLPVVEGTRVAGTRVAGILSVHDLGRLPREQWARARVRDLMRPLNEFPTAAPEDSLLAAFENLAENNLGRLAVVEDHRLVGYLGVKDAVRVLTMATVESSGGRGRVA